ncbi:MAG: hypothetical protein QNJ53_26310 [Pleurocapsa sp. MO_192.B19]|nr:hypothetical protein [Pleurocapsa sp. MO_192.B19]
MLPKIYERSPSEQNQNTKTDLSIAISSTAPQKQLKLTIPKYQGQQNDLPKYN